MRSSYEWILLRDLYCSLSGGFHAAADMMLKLRNMNIPAYYRCMFICI